MPESVSQREHDSDLGALARGARHVQLTIVGADKLGNHGQADSATADSGGLLAAEEPLEDMRQLVRLDAHAGVADAERGLAFPRPALEPDGAAGRGELQRVDEQV